MWFVPLTASSLAVACKLLILYKHQLWLLAAFPPTLLLLFPIKQKDEPPARLVHNLPICCHLIVCKTFCIHHSIEQYRMTLHVDMPFLFKGHLCEVVKSFWCQIYFEAYVARLLCMPQLFYFLWNSCEGVMVPKDWLFGICIIIFISNINGIMQIGGKHL